jgi:nitrogen fixation/metabolism regulation signal transduction histidine kinase
VFEAGYTTADAGTGYGLAIVKEIADDHGWNIEVGQSDLGGALFDIRGVDRPV